MSDKKKDTAEKSVSSLSRSGHDSQRIIIAFICLHNSTWSDEIVDRWSCFCWSHWQQGSSWQFGLLSLLLTISILTRSLHDDETTYTGWIFCRRDHSLTSFLNCNFWFLFSFVDVMEVSIMQAEHEIPMRVVVDRVPGFSSRPQSKRPMDTLHRKAFNAYN